MQACRAQTACVRPRPRFCAPRARAARHTVRALDYERAAGHAEPQLADRARKVQLFYTEAWANNTPDLLDDICARGVTYSDARGGGSDAFGRAGVAEMICDCCSSHPLLRIVVDDISLDASGATATAEWRATAAHLLPGRAGGRPTGLVSDVMGLDQITFGSDGRITSIVSFRDRWAEEQEAAARAALADAGAGAGAGGGAAGDGFGF